MSGRSLVYRRFEDLLSGYTSVLASDHNYQLPSVGRKEANVNFVENLSLIQEYKMINDTTWFLAKDKFVADVSPIGKDRPGFIGRKTTTYQNIAVNDSSVLRELNKNKILEEIITLPDAAEHKKEFWAGARHEPLSKTESGIIKMIDTLTNARFSSDSLKQWHLLEQAIKTSAISK